MRVLARGSLQNRFLRGSIEKIALSLLTENDQLLFARYGIRDYKGDYLVVASVDLLLSTLDPEELRGSMTTVALAADKWERTTGKDDF